MKAALLYGTKDLRIEQIPVPEPGAGEALVKVEACGVCPTDVKRYLGKAIPPHYPFVLGHEAAGTIVKIGAGTQEQTRLKAGDRVVGGNIITCGACPSCRDGRLETVGLGACYHQEIFGVTVDGGFCEYAVMPLSILEKIPDSMPFATAALVEPVACCLNGVEKADIHTADLVLVIGAGFMGLTQLQLAKLKGARVAVSDMMDERLETARLLGADLVINPAKENLGEQLQKYNDGEMADVVLCSVGAAGVVTQGLSVLNRGARLVIIGGVHPPKNIEFDPNDIHYKQASIIGSVSYTQSGFVNTIRLLAEGKLATDVLQSERIVVEDLEQAFIDVSEARGLRKCVLF